MLRKTRMLFSKQPGWLEVIECSLQKETCNFPWSWKNIDILSFFILFIYILFWFFSQKSLYVFMWIIDCTHSVRCKVTLWNVLTRLPPISSHTEQLQLHKRSITTSIMNQRGKLQPAKSSHIRAADIMPATSTTTVCNSYTVYIKKYSINSSVHTHQIFWNTIVALNRSVIGILSP